MPVVASDAVELTSFTSAIDLLRTVTGGKEVVRAKVVTATAGATITCKTKSSRTDARTLHVSQGDELNIALRTIDSATNVTALRIEWGD